MKWLALLLCLWVAPAYAGESWKVYQNGTLCCAFATLESAQEFVRMQESTGNHYTIYYVNDDENK